MTPYYADDWLTIHGGDCREVMATMEPESVQCVVTSPPYWGLRDYGVAGQLGLEPTPEAYVAAMVEVFREVRHVLRSDGTVWLNLGDSYAGSGMTGWTASKEGSAKRTERMFHGNRRDTVPGLAQKQLVGIPWRVAFALQADGWYLRSDIIWAKPNPMPESVTDRPTKSHEYVFLLSKSPRYYFDADAVGEPLTDSSVARLSQGGIGQQEGSWRVPGKTNGAMKAVGGPSWQERKAAGATAGNVGVSATYQNGVHGDGLSHDLGRGATRNIRSVWNIATQPYPGAHFAVFPEKLVEPCVLAGCPDGGVVLDPFGGSGTVGRVANRLGRRAVLIDLNPDYLAQQIKRAVEGVMTPLGLPA